MLHDDGANAKPEDKASTVGSETATKAPEFDFRPATARRSAVACHIAASRAQSDCCTFKMKCSIQAAFHLAPPQRPISTRRRAQFTPLPTSPKGRPTILRTSKVIMYPTNLETTAGLWWKRCLARRLEIYLEEYLLTSQLSIIFLWPLMSVCQYK